MGLADSECANLVCLNGGTCYTQIVGDEIANEYCICPSDKTGDTCAEHKPCSLSCVYGKCQYPFTIAGADTDAAVDNEPFCKCDEGYSGILCESKIDVCPDGKRSCYNGGKCVEMFHENGGRLDGKPFNPPKYKCDCSVIDQKSPFAGLECQHEPERICSIMTVNKSSFCVNGGVCRDTVMTENVHKGCDCKPGFEGDHCEFEEGTNPENNRLHVGASEIATNKVGSNSGISSKAINGVGAFIVVFALIVTFLGGISTARRMKKRKQALQAATAAYEDNDLAFDADGNRMTNISIGEPGERGGEVI